MLGDKYIETSNVSARSWFSACRYVDRLRSWPDICFLNYLYTITLMELREQDLDTANRKSQLGKNINRIA